MRKEICDLLAVQSFICVPVSVTVDIMVWEVVTPAVRFSDPKHQNVPDSEPEHTGKHGARTAELTFNCAVSKKKLDLALFIGHVSRHFNVSFLSPGQYDPDDIIWDMSSNLGKQRAYTAVQTDLNVSNQWSFPRYVTQAIQFQSQASPGHL